MEFPLGPEQRRKRIRHAIKCAERNEEVIAGEHAAEDPTFGFNLADDELEALTYERQKAMRDRRTKA